MNGLCSARAWVVTVAWPRYAVSVLREAEAIGEARESLFSFREQHDVTVSRFEGAGAHDAARDFASQFQELRDAAVYGGGEDE